MSPFALRLKQEYNDVKKEMKAHEFSAQCQELVEELTDKYEALATEQRKIIEHGKVERKHSQR